MKKKPLYWEILYKIIKKNFLKKNFFSRYILKVEVEKKMLWGICSLCITITVTRVVWAGALGRSVGPIFLKNGIWEHRTTSATPA